MGGTIVALAALMRGLGAIMEARTTRVFKKTIRSIPPSILPSELPVTDEVELTRENERLRGDLHRAQWRIDELEMQLNEVGRDHGLTARSLTREREDCERMHVRVLELEDMLRAVNSGASTHLPTHTSTRGSSPSWDAVDDRPTPRLGSKRVRRP